MAQIAFERWQQTACFHNPLKGGQLDEQQIEVRLDPLTGHQSVFNAALEDKSGVLFPPTDEAYIEERARDTREQCFLCDGKWRRTTPTYDSRLCPEGRIVKGEAVLFPNLFPLAAYHAVVMLGERHYRRLNDFPAPLLADAFSVSLELIRRAHRAEPKMTHFTINANYLLPAGSSVFHPHMQVLGSPFPGTHERLLLEKSREYRKEKGSCYWLDLVETEKSQGGRWLGALGPSRWLTAYSPMGANEVNAVWPEALHFLQWGDPEIQGVAEGVSRVLAGYEKMGLSTFNFSCYSGPLDGSAQDFRCLLRLINRQNAAPHYRTDDYYFQKLLENEIIVQRPELLASTLRSDLARVS